MTSLPRREFIKLSGKAAAIVGLLFPIAETFKYKTYVRQ